MTVRFFDDVEQLAEKFAHMDRDKQARFFNHVYEVSRVWCGTSWRTEMHWVLQSKDLSYGGREVLQTISNIIQDLNKAQEGGKND